MMNDVVSLCKGEEEERKGDEKGERRRGRDDKEERMN